MQEIEIPFTGLAPIPSMGELEQSSRFSRANASLGLKSNSSIGEVTVEDIMNMIPFGKF